MRAKGMTVDRILLGAAREVTLIVGVKPSWRYRLRVWIASILFAAGALVAGFGARIEWDTDESETCST